MGHLAVRAFGDGIGATLMQYNGLCGSQRYPRIDCPVRHDPTALWMRGIDIERVIVGGRRHLCYRSWPLMGRCAFFTQPLRAPTTVVEREGFS